MYSVLYGNADGLESGVHQRVYPGETLAYSIENIRRNVPPNFFFEGVHYSGPDAL